MPKYLLEVNYTLDGLRGLKSEGGSARVAAAKGLIEGMGGKMECFYFALGATDVYAIADLPDNASAAAAALTVSAGGGATVRTVALLTAAEVDEAAAKDAAYRPPGT
ncbi:MAG: GYD domain-containing protein [Acidimicrobiales bacterium]